MRGAAVALAAVVVLAGCGTDTSDRTSASSDASASASAGDRSAAAPSPADESSDGSTGKPHKGHSAKGTPKPSPTVPADAPACAAVWRDGQRLARDYEGCMDRGQFVTVDQEPCSFGQRLVRFGGHFYAVRGGPVNRTAAPLTKDRDYRGAIASCRA